jgi:hypothetical protein
VQAFQKYLLENGWSGEVGEGEDEKTIVAGDLDADLEKKGLDF